MLQRLNSPWLALLFLAGFIALAYSSLHREVGYTHSVFDVLPKTLLQKQAEALADIYHLTGREDAIDIWGK